MHVPRLHFKLPNVTLLQLATCPDTPDTSKQSHVGVQRIGYVHKDGGYTKQLPECLTVGLSREKSGNREN